MRTVIKIKLLPHFLCNVALAGSKYVCAYSHSPDRKTESFLAEDDKLLVFKNKEAAENFVSTGLLYSQESNFIYENISERNFQKILKDRKNISGNKVNFIEK